MNDPSHGPLTETITIGAATRGGLTAHAWNGAQRVLVASALYSYADLAVRSPALVRDGAALRECLPGVRARDVLDLLAAGKCGEFAVEVHPVPSARRDIDFAEAA